MTGGGAAGEIGLSVVTGLVPILNPLFMPIHMAIFIFMFIILLAYGFSYKTSLLIGWLIPAAVGAVIAYSIISAASKLTYRQAVQVQPQQPYKY